MDTILKASTTIHKCIFTSKLILETLIWRSKLKMAKFIKTKNMPSLPVITFATETNTHKKNFGKVSKSIILMIEGGKGMTNFLIIKPTHTYITLHTMYLLCIMYYFYIKSSLSATSTCQSIKYVLQRWWCLV